MAALVWVTLGIAIWHFSIFVPDRFRGGIVGAFLGAVFGAVLTGGLVQLARGTGIGETDLLTALAAVPGCLLGLAAVYALGVREERAVAEGPAPARSGL